MDKPLEEVDPELNKLIQEEETRQREGLELIASENFTSRAVRQCLGSVLTNKYSEGLPGKRYYGGNEVIDKIESLAKKRSLEAFGVNNEEYGDWDCNVQPYSGSPANFAVYTGLLNPGDRIMGLDLPSGGHLTHGFYTAKKKISASSIYFQSLPYRVGDDGFIDYDKLEEMAVLFKPRMIICGASAYPRDFDYERFRAVANKIGAYLMCDMAHISGLVASGVMKSPFKWCDVVTTTTHKSLRGPRAAVIFSRKELIGAINEAVFPALQGGPHEHQIAGIACQMREVQSDEFKNYSFQVVKNCKAMADELMERGYNLVSNGTDNHLILVNLKSKGITGSKVEKICDLVGVTINKNCVPGDISALSPGGVRVGTPAMTSRGFKEVEFVRVAEILDECINLAIKVQNSCGSRKLVDFNRYLNNNVEIIDVLKKLKQNVKEFAKNYRYVGE